jgi:hypothetical protein
MSDETDERDALEEEREETEEETTMSDEAEEAEGAEEEREGTEGETKDEEQMQSQIDDESAVCSQLEEKLDLSTREGETPVSTPQTTSAKSTPTMATTPLDDRTPSPSPAPASISPSSSSATTEKLPKLSPSLSPNILAFKGAEGETAPATTTATATPGTLQGVVEDIASLVPNGNIRAIAQLQGNVLSELKATNKTLADFNIFSEEKYASISPDVLKLAKNLKGIKTDLDYIYKKTHSIKMKLKGKYPAAFVETKANTDDD